MEDKYHVHHDQYSRDSEPYYNTYEPDQRSEASPSHSYDDSSYHGMAAIDLSQPVPAEYNNPSTPSGGPSAASPVGPYETDNIDAAIAAEMEQYQADMAREREGEGVSMSLQEWENSLLGQSSLPSESWVKRFAQPLNSRDKGGKSDGEENASPVRKLPPSISQSFHEHDIIMESKKKKKPEYGRPTLLHARDHDLYESRVLESSDSEEEPESHSKRLSHSPQLQKRDHPLREALRTKSDKLNLPKGSHVSKEVSPHTKSPSSSVPHHPTRRSISPSRIQHKGKSSDSDSKRYLTTPTDSSLAKMKKQSSSVTTRLIASRLPGDWH